MKVELPVISDYIKGRGAQINPTNPFDSVLKSVDPRSHFSDFDHKEIRTIYIESKAKSIINQVDSPDIGLTYSLNPYQGCEHGCVYCYARNTHNYWGYSGGLDFETKIVVKTNAAELLDKQLSRKKWNAAPIMLSGNTDCYQPADKKYEITRDILKVLWKHKHPVGIVTKNTLILRDLDILQNMAQHNLVNVAISINTVDDKLRQKLEPRASSVATRLALIEKLSRAGIPVTVLAAPIIPGLNDTDIIKLARKVSDAGASTLHHIVVRLNGSVKEIFSDWLSRNYDGKKEKVLNKIKALHKGSLSDSRFVVRMKGDGVIAEMINQQFKVARNLFMLDNQPFEYNTELYYQSKLRQGVLF
jgi:DNA repair photolyase